MYVHECAYLGLIFVSTNVFGVMFHNSTNWLPALISLDVILYNLWLWRKREKALLVGMSRLS